jgi:hypothetical protein
MSHKLGIALVFCAALLQSCSQPTLHEKTQQETQVHAPSSTRTSEPSRTPIPSPSATNTIMPSEIAEAALHSYIVILSIQINAELVDEVARRIQSGELTGYDRYGAMLAVSALIEEVHRLFPEVAAPDPLSEPWNTMLDVHERTREIIRAWFNDEINTGEVLQTIAPIIDEADNVLLETQQIMSDTFEFEPAALTRERSRILDSLPKILESRGSSPIE